MSSSQNASQQIEQIVTTKPVVLFMKGNRQFPQCGFSATVVQILDGLLESYETVNVLSDPGIRQGIKDYSQWPTIPQLYIGGEFVGGCDIVKEMHAAGDLADKLGVTVEPAEPPTITVTPLAAERLNEAFADAEDGERVQISVDARFRTALGFAKGGAGLLEFEAGGVAFLTDPISAKRAGGITIDFQERADGGGFRIDNPNAPAQMKQMDGKELAAKLESGEVKELFDVRPPAEREKASIKGAKPLDDDAVTYIEGLDKDTVLVFYCHVGMRSQSAAQHFVEQGFTNVYNLRGGIKAWSSDVDPSVPTY